MVAMSALKLARSSFGRPALKALRLSTAPGKFEPRGTGGIKAVLMAGRPIRSTCRPFFSQRQETPIIGLLLALRSLTVGISMTIASRFERAKKFRAWPGPGLFWSAGRGRGYVVPALSWPLIN